MASCPCQCHWQTLLRALITASAGKGLANLILAITGVRQPELCAAPQCPAWGFLLVLYTGLWQHVPQLCTEDSSCSGSDSFYSSLVLPSQATSFSSINNPTTEGHSMDSTGYPLSGVKKFCLEMKFRLKSHLCNKKLAWVF